MTGRPIVCVHSLYRHLHEVHKPDDKSAAQVRIQMQLVNQLEAQVRISDAVDLLLMLLQGDSQDFYVGRA